MIGAVGKRRRGMELAGAPILLTGASSGIGRGLASVLAERGARLAIAARRRPQMEELATEIAAAGHPRPYVIESDLSVQGAAASLARTTLETLGTVHILINNAGVGLVGAQAVVGDDAVARDLFETDFWSPIELTRRLLPAIRSAGGMVVNVTSSLQAVPVPMLGYYGAAKVALAHATRALRNELRSTGVAVLEIVPGATDTDARDIDLLPWRTGPMRAPAPVSPESAARSIVRAIEGGRTRNVHPAASVVPLEFPAVGRLLASIAARRIDTPQPEVTVE